MQGRRAPLPRRRSSSNPLTVATLSFRQNGQDPPFSVAEFLSMLGEARSQDRKAVDLLLCAGRPIHEPPPTAEVLVRSRCAVLYAVAGEDQIHWRIAFGSYFDAFSIEVRRQKHALAGPGPALPRDEMVALLKKDGGVLRYADLPQSPLALFLGEERAALAPDGPFSLWQEEGESPWSLGDRWVALNPTTWPFESRDADGAFSFVGQASEDGHGSPRLGALIKNGPPSPGNSVAPVAALHCNNFSTRPENAWSSHFSSVLFQSPLKTPQEMTAPLVEKRGGQGPLSWRYARYELLSTLPPAISEPDRG
jgi:hypothetical protein